MAAGLAGHLFACRLLLAHVELPPQADVPLISLARKKGARNGQPLAADTRKRASQRDPVRTSCRRYDRRSSLIDGREGFLWQAKVIGKQLARDMR